MFVVPESIRCPGGFIFRIRGVPSRHYLSERSYCSPGMYWLTRRRNGELSERASGWRKLLNRLLSGLPRAFLILAKLDILDANSMARQVVNVGMVAG